MPELTITETKVRGGIVLSAPFTIAASESADFTIPFADTRLNRPGDWRFTGYGSAKLVMTGSAGGQITVQQNHDLIGTDYDVAVDYATGLVIPPLISAQAYSTKPKITIANILLPAVPYAKFTLTEVGGAASVVGTFYLYLMIERS
jgi:hypothetical protein